jgi:hypothetical protein
LTYERGINLRLLELIGKRLKVMREANEAVATLCGLSLNPDSRMGSPSSLKAAESRFYPRAKLSA